MIPNSYAKVFLTCLITAGAAASQSKIKDVILQKSGQRIRGVEVVEMTSSTIKYRDGDEEKEILASALARVQWYEPPESFMLATAAVARGKFAEAANLYSEAIRGTERRALKQEAEFLAAEALVKSSGGDQAKATAAVKALNDYLTSTPDGYRLPDTLLLLGKAMVFAGQAAEAETALLDLESRTSSEGWDKIWSVRAKFEKAKAQLAQGKLNDARGAFRAAVTAGGALAKVDSSPEINQLIASASVGEGDTLVADQKFELAVEFFRRLLGSSENRAITAAAQAGLGEALYLNAVATGSDRDLREAQLALAKANILDGNAMETSAKALFYAGRVLLALGPTREQQDYKSRAIEYFRTVTRYYPQTVWAGKASAELDQ